MPRPVTLAELRTRALRAADMTTVATLQYLPPDEQNSIINESYSDLWDKGVLAYEDYFVSEYQLTLVPGTWSYPLPSDFYKARTVLWWSGSPNTAVGLDWFEEPERASLLSGSQQDRPKAKIDGTPNGPALTVLPATTSAKLTLRYVPNFQALINDTDTINPNIPSGWEQYIVYDAAAKYRGKVPLDTSRVEARLAKVALKIDQVKGQRQASGQRRVRDVYGFSKMRGGRDC